MLGSGDGVNEHPGSDQGPEVMNAFSDPEPLLKSESICAESADNSSRWVQPQRRRRFTQISWGTGVGRRKPVKYPG